MRRGIARLRPKLEWLGVVGLVGWAISFYISWSNLAVVSFGPAEIASIAKRDLFLRYGAGLLASGALWLWLWLLAKRGQMRQSGNRRRGHRSSRRGTVHSG